MDTEYTNKEDTIIEITHNKLTDIELENKMLKKKIEIYENTIKKLKDKKKLETENEALRKKIGVCKKIIQKKDPNVLKYNRSRKEEIIAHLEDHEDSLSLSNKLEDHNLLVAITNAINILRDTNDKYLNYYE